MLVSLNRDSTASTSIADAELLVTFTFPPGVLELMIKSIAESVPSVGLNLLKLNEVPVVTTFWVAL